MSNQIDPNWLFRIFDVWQQLNVVFVGDMFVDVFLRSLVVFFQIGSQHVNSMSLEFVDMGDLGSNN